MGDLHSLHITIWVIVMVYTKQFALSTNMVCSLLTLNTVDPLFLEFVTIPLALILFHSSSLGLDIYRASKGGTTRSILLDCFSVNRERCGFSGVRVAPMLIMWWSSSLVKRSVTDDGKNWSSVNIPLLKGYMPVWMLDGFTLRVKVIFTMDIIFTIREMS